MEIFRGRRLWIEMKTIRLPTGREREKVIVHPSGAVAILPLDKGRCRLLRHTGTPSISISSKHRREPWRRVKTR